MIRMPMHVIHCIRQAIAYYGAPSVVLKKVLKIWRREGLSGLRRRAAAISAVAQSVNRPGGFDVASSLELYGSPPVLHPDFLPKVSVIVPNFNHAAYLRKRLDSIYDQTYRNLEVILLDDCSSDDSRAILSEYAE